ncbi:acyltransferase family protein [Galbitalea sp. SE-J8]|uniref:acyltransferase family protein n=1 Tax=Galbitalea sp. SE-J8 TaxID=3054952 RepID=UPI00259CA54A|nr:acyltransferase family protein [Galbitalea sp. SE-J8]
MTTLTTSPAPATSKPDLRAAKTYFRTDVEGLRAIAVIMVVAFHASVPLFGGGFVGVDAFFVISGYLITGQLIREAQQTGRISFRNFYARRARRILPAATLVLLAIAGVSIAVEPLVGVYANARDLLASAVFYSNWHFIDLGTDYLAQSTNDSPVLHYWSLAVEEQFYLVWPLLVLLAVAIARRFPFRGSQIVLGVIGTVTAVSLVTGIVLTVTDPQLAYMATTTRAWEFGVGGIVAAVGHWLQFLAQRRGMHAAGIAIGWAGVGALVVTSVSYDGSTPFPGVAAILPVLGTAAIIAGGLLAGTGRGTVGALLSLRPIRYLGRISFGWYLWHWPVLILVERVTGPLAWPQRSVLMLIALLLAAATLHFVEQPLGRWTTVARNIAPALALGLLCMVLSVTASLSVGTNAVATLTASAAKIDTASFAKVFGGESGANSGSVSPDPISAPNDRPKPDDCLLDHERDRVRSCEFGTPGGTEVVLFGDSHAHQWMGAVGQIAEERGWHVSVFAKAGCPVADLTPIGDGGRYSQPECVDWRHEAIDLITTQVKPALIITSSLSSYLTDDREMYDKWEVSLDKLRELNVPIVYIKDTPHPSQDIPTCVSGAFDDWSKCAFPDDARTDILLQNALTGDEKDVVPVDLTPYFCDDGTCQAVRNHYLLYRDDSHLTATAAKALTPALEDAMVQAGVIPAS